MNLPVRESLPSFSAVCIFVICSLSSLVQVRARQFYVGGRDGWVVHPAEDYNHWAGRNRFLITDTLLFKYKKGKDSVLLVNKDGYDQCDAHDPIKKWDDGDTVFQFDRFGPFYFISGRDGNCRKGQKLIVVVLAFKPRPLPLPPGKAPGSGPPGSSTPAMAPGSGPPGSSTPATSPSPSTSPATTPAHAPAMGPSSLSPSPTAAPGSSTPATSPSPSTSPATTPAHAPAMGPSSLSPSPTAAPGSSTPATSPSPSTSPATTPTHAPATGPSSASPSSAPTATAPASGPTAPGPSGASPPASSTTSPAPGGGSAQSSPPAATPSGVPANSTSPPPGQSAAQVVDPLRLSMWASAFLMMVLGQT
ncbi:early nodulin-like protein 2 isoform X1 [Rhodamnia argentea]|uniref:Early nodulin-like protein 2 isoform X1 n=1 Tax=Rhodamnia argentea TaxID=178133 RepID=A0A8B8MQ93_9MYRT|nr:early nodulin-like protein 2 isoform X1 [Rhodamnia argentea]